MRPPAFDKNVNCAKVDPDLMTPDKDDYAANQAARNVCRGCPIQQECLAWSLETRTRHGVWGGLTERQRVGLIRKRVTAAGGAVDA